MNKYILLILISFNLLYSQKYEDEVISKNGEKYKVDILKILGNEITFEVLNKKGNPFIVQTIFDSLLEVNSIRNGLKINIWKHKPKIIIAEKKPTLKFEEEKYPLIDSTLLKQLENDSINVGDLRTPTEVISRFHRVDHKPVILRDVEPIYSSSVFDKNFRDTLILKLWINRQGDLKIIEVHNFTNDEMIQPTIDAVNKFLFTPAVVENLEVGVWGELNYTLQSEKPESFFEAKIIEEAKPADDSQILKLESDSINIGDLSKPLDLTNSQIDKKPTILKSFSPNYPPILYAKKISCVTRAKVWISKDGESDKIEILETTNEYMVNAIKNIINKWKFNPAQYKKKNLGVWAEIVFELRFE